ncbi:MAG: phosphoribosylglycinamide formyltransferase [Spirochaetes bacterium]|nr:MAG: phosphoribosylglycinamide formyltransferase [Spirochaetota bacterium]
MLRLAVLASGNGSNLQAILDAYEGGLLRNLQPVLCVADRSCKALERAAAWGLETVLLEGKHNGEKLSEALGRQLSDRRIDIAALAGWLSIISGKLTREWTGRMVNIHPSLLPEYGGRGMYGEQVHKAVLDAGEKQSGCTVHFVTDSIDGGKILGQSRVKVLKNDTPDSLAARILIEEHQLYPKILADLTDSFTAE